MDDAGADEALELMEGRLSSQLEHVAELGRLAGRRMGKFPSYAELVDLLVELKELVPQSAEGNAMVHALGSSAAAQSGASERHTARQRRPSRQLREYLEGS